MKTNARLLHEQYRELFARISAILLEHDPMDIDYGTNHDEYDSEARSILSRLPEASCENDVRRIVHETFLHWFGEAGEATTRKAVAHEIWIAWVSRDEGRS